MKNKKIFCLRIIGFSLAVMIMVLIFYMSAQNSQASSETSGGLIDFIARIFNSQYDSMSEQGREEYVAGFQFIVRKSAHFSAYCALAFYLSLAGITFVNIKKRYRFLLSFLITVFYAVTDEIHQLFVVGRSCELRDIFIDSGGALLGCFLLWVVYLICKKIKAFGK